MKKNYTEEDMLKVIQEVEAEFSNALAKAEAELNKNENTDDTSSENLEQEVEGLYASMEKSEAELHFKAISKVLNVSEMNKSEDNTLLKTELDSIKASNEELTKSNEELKKNLEQAVAIIAKSLKTKEAPAQKAITSEVEYIAKSESDKVNSQVDLTKLSKSDIAQKLSSKIRSGDLAKADKDLIVKFYEGNIQLETIKHLL
jgi:hypothetical protein